MSPRQVRELIPEAGGARRRGLRAAPTSAASTSSSAACSARAWPRPPGSTRRPRGSASGCAPGSCTSRRTSCDHPTAFFGSPASLRRRTTRRGPRKDVERHPGARRRVRTPRGRSAPPGVGGRRLDPARAAPDRGQAGAARRRLPRGGRRRGGTLLDSVDLQEAMFEAGASSGLMAGLFTGGIALPHIARLPAMGNADLVDRFVRPTLAGETDRLARGHRARRRLRRRRHPHHRGARRRPLRRQRRQDLHHQRRPRRLRDHRGPHRRPRPRRRLAARRRGRHARLHRRPVAAQDGLALLRHRRAVLRRRAGPGRQPGRPGERRLLPDRRAVRGRADRASPCTPTASRPARSS